MKRFIQIICLVLCLAFQASLCAVDIQTAGGGALINGIDESVVRLWAKLVDDLWPAPAGAPAALPHVIQLPAGADYAAIVDANHEIIKLLQKLQEILNSNPGLFAQANLAVNEEKIVDKVSDIKFMQPEAVFAVNDLNRHPKKKFFSHEVTQRNIDPQDVFPYLRAAYDHNFAPQICSGLARLYAIALFNSMRHINNDENELLFLRTPDINHIPDDKKQAFINLNEANLADCVIKNEIKRQYLGMFCLWIDGKSVNVSTHGVVATNICHEVEWLMRAQLIPPVTARPIPVGKTILELAQDCFNYLISWKNFFKKQIPGFLGGISNPVWQESWWVGYLPEELGKEVEKLSLIHKRKRLTTDRIENLDVNDLIQLSNAGQVPPFNHAPVVPTLRKVALQWVQDWAYLTWKTWLHDDEDIWKFIDKNSKPVPWLAMLPTQLVQEVCRYYRCAVIQEHGVWVDVPHICQSRNCSLPIHYLTEYGVLPLPQGVDQAGLEGMNEQAQARAYAIDFIAQTNNNPKNIKVLEAHAGCMPQAFKQEVCRQYALQTAWRGMLLKDLKAFAGHNNDALTTTLAEALQNNEVKNSLATKINHDHILDLSGMHLREITALDFVGGPNAIAGLPGVNLAQVTELDLSNNQLQQFSVGILDYFPALQVLKLSHNRLQTLPENLFGNIGAGLVLHLKAMHLDHNQITQLPKGLFKGLEQNPTFDVIDLSNNQLQNPDYMPLFGALKVRFLNMGHNQLQTLPNNIFSHTMPAHGHVPVAVNDHTLRDHIHELNFAHNQLTLAMNNPVYQAFHSLQGGTLEYLDLSNNNIAQVHPLVHCRINSLKHLFLDGNQIVAVMSQNGAGAVHNMDNLVTLSLADNQLTAIAQNDLVSFPRLKRLILSGNRIAAIADRANMVDASELSHLSWLELLMLDGNELVNIGPKTFKNLKRLNVLHLEGNKINTILPNSFRELERLTTLYLYANSRVFSQEDGLADTTIHVGAFDGLVNLSHLDLSFNRIKVLDNDVFRGLSLLTHLNLSHNKLKRVACSFDPLVKLQEVDLSANRLEALDGQAFSTCSKNLKQVYFKKNNAVGLFKPVSQLALLKLYLPYHLAKIPVSGYITRLILGNGVNVDMEGLNKLTPDMVRVCRALKENSKFYVPGLLYLLRGLGAQNNVPDINRSLLPHNELLGDDQLGTITQKKKLATIDNYFADMENLYRKITFGQKRDAKVVQQQA